MLQGYAERLSVLYCLRLHKYMSFPMNQTKYEGPPSSEDFGKNPQTRICQFHCADMSFSPRLHLIATSTTAVEVNEHIERRAGLVGRGLKCRCLHSLHCCYYGRDVFRPAQAVVPGYEGHHFSAFRDFLKLCSILQYIFYYT